MSKRTIKLKPPKSDAWFQQEIRFLQIRAGELEKRLKHEQGPAAFAAYQEAVKAKIEQKADTGNVVRFRGHRRVQ